MAFNLNPMNKPITNIKIKIAQAKQLQRIIKINHEHLHQTKSFLYHEDGEVFVIHSN